MNDDELLTYRYPRTMAQAWPYEADLRLQEEPEADKVELWAAAAQFIFACLTAVGCVSSAFFLLGYLWHRSAA